MANQFVNLPLPAGNGAGAAVNTSSMGKTKSIVVEGTFPGATITIDISLDGGVTWAPVTTFVGKKGEYVSDFVAQFMRTNVSGRGASFSATIDVGANNDGALFASLPPGPIGVPGASVATSLFGGFKTVLVGGASANAVVYIEASEDGVSWATVIGIQGSDQKSFTFVADFMRSRLVRGSVTSITVGAANDAGSGLDVGRELLPENWQQQDVPAAQAATAMAGGVSQLFDDYQTIRAGSVIGLNLRFNANVTAGTATAVVTVGGVPTAVSVTVAAGSSSGRATALVGANLFAAGGLIGVTLETSANFAPATLDAEASVEIDT